MSIGVSLAVPLYLSLPASGSLLSSKLGDTDLSVWLSEKAEGHTWSVVSQGVCEAYGEPSGQRCQPSRGVSVTSSFKPVF